MFAHLKGTISNVHADTLVIDVGGVGYLVSASRLTLSQLQEGEACTLLIETMMRQESLHLFGFLSREEQDWFRLLLTVQGVGPKVALGILGSMSLSELMQAIAMQDKTMVSRADGVGPKLAGRLLLELKDKFKNLPNVGGQHSNVSAPSVSSSAYNDALSALENLGYSRFEAQKALQNVPDAQSLSSSDLIRQGLQQMQMRKVAS